MSPRPQFPPASGTPARRYSWAPFAPGNAVSTHHGAFSERRVAPLAQRLVEQVVADNGYLQDPSYASALHSWGRTEARIELVSAWLIEKGDLDPQGKVRPAADLLNRLEARAENLRSALGLTPLARARLGRDISGSQFDLARAWQIEDEQAAEGEP